MVHLSLGEISYYTRAGQVSSPRAPKIWESLADPRRNDSYPPFGVAFLAHVYLQQSKPCATCTYWAHVLNC